jgi:hypothetical protein
MEADLASNVLPKPFCIEFCDGNADCGFCIKRAVSGRGMCGVWMAGGLRKVAISCGEGPDAATWFCDRWLICDCCCARRASSLSRRDSTDGQLCAQKSLCILTSLGELTAVEERKPTYQAHGHSQLSGQASFVAGRSGRHVNGAPNMLCDLDLRRSNDSSDTNHLQGAGQFITKTNSVIP